MFARDKRIGPYTYVYLVENVREEGRTKQRIIANLGRKEVVVARGDLDRLARSVVRLAQRSMVLSLVEGEAPPNARCQRIGPAVEQLFRQAKAVLATRPIYHSSDRAIRGHVFCSFLALLLVKELEDRLHRHNIAAEWDDILRDLDRLQEIELEQDGKRFRLRTPTTGVAGKLFQAVGVALPPNLQELARTTPQPAA